jgi:hypothetical protein
MAEWEHALNAYEVLGLAQGSKATDAEIGKVGKFCRQLTPPSGCTAQHVLGAR